MQTEVYLKPTGKNRNGFYKGETKREGGIIKKGGA